MKTAELVFIPSPGVGHLVPAVELAKLMVSRNEHLSFTILLMKPSLSDTKVTNYITSVASSLTSYQINVTNLPSNDQETHDPRNFLASFIEGQKTHVREAVSKLILSPSAESSSPPRHLAGFIVDMFCTAMIDVANEIGVESYVFFPSSAASLGLAFHLLALNDDHNVDTTQYKDSNIELIVPSFHSPVPGKVLPSTFFNKDWNSFFSGNVKRYGEAKGIIINTFMELESHAINSIPLPVYPVGPILNLKGHGHDHFSSSHTKDEIMAWLDDQPPLSVMFLCFGSMGSLCEDQVKEIAYAIDHSGYRFLWSLRQPSPKGKMQFPTDYTYHENVLPSGFLDRAAEIGRVIGWAPQVSILAHPSIGGFVSHCGWNSVLESLWYGVPIATWPLFAEQQLNAFGLIVELGLAVEIKMDYRKDHFSSDDETVVSADNIERAIRCVMVQDSDVRKRVKEISEKSKIALMNGGSSSSSIDRLIAKMMENIR